MNPEEDYEVERQALLTVFEENRRNGVDIDRVVDCAAIYGRVAATLLKKS